MSDDPPVVRARLSPEACVYCGHGIHEGRCPYILDVLWPYTCDCPAPLPTREVQ